MSRVRQNWLFVSPHPDDVEIGCGPLIPKIPWEGGYSCIAVCTGMGDLKMMHSGQTVGFIERVEEQKLAAKELQADMKWLNLAPASKFDQVPQSKFVEAFDALFPHFENVVVPLPSYNNDHMVVWKAALASMRPGKADRTSFYAYEQPFSNALGPQLDQTLGKKYVQVTEMDVRAAEAALLKHESQMKGREGSIYGPASLRRMAQLRGSEIGVEFAVRLLTIREYGL